MRSFPRERASGILVDFIRVGSLLSFAMQRTRLFSCSRSMAEYFSPTTIKCLSVFKTVFPFKRNYISSDFSIAPRRYVGPKLNALPSLFLKNKINSFLAHTTQIFKKVPVEYHRYEG